MPRRGVGLSFRINQMKLILTKPITFEGQKYESLDLDMESLSGADFRKFKKDYLKLLGNYNPIMASATIASMDDDFALYVASVLAEKPLELFDNLSVPDYVAVVRNIETFFNSSASAIA